MMDHDQLLSTLSTSTSLKLLRNPNAPLILSFLQREFKAPGHVTVQHSLLVERLDLYLEGLRERDPTVYPLSAPQYLRQWCDEEHHFLRKYHETGSDDPVYELAADSERTLGWIDDLRGKEFVGTESRFLRIFDLLQEIVEMSTENVDERLAQLEEQKAELQRQIDTIQANGRVDPSSSTQIKERFYEANDVARHLIADFREVEENFRAIARSVQKQQFQAGVSKGQIVGYVLDADLALKESDQGRSFDAFWHFLISQNKQEELRRLIEQVYQLSILPGERDDQRVLRQLKRRLIDAGSKIVHSNRRLADQLRKLLDEQRQAEARRVQELIAEIKQSAIQIREHFPSDDAFITLDGLPAIHLPMERQLWQPNIKTEFASIELAVGSSQLSESDIDALFQQVYVDEGQLRRNIERLLEESPRVALSTLIQRFPLQHGLTELMTYLAIAAKSHQHLFNSTEHEMIMLSDERTVTLPQIIFRNE